MIGTDELGLQPYVIYQEKDTDYYKQIFYEDKDSLKKKVDTAKKYNLGGVALWAIGYEGSDMLTPLKEYKNITSF
jgi:spore germination protein YaaH